MSVLILAAMPGFHGYPGFPGIEEFDPKTETNSYFSL